MVDRTEDVFVSIIAGTDLTGPIVTSVDGYVKTKGSFKGFQDRKIVPITIDCESEARAYSLGKLVIARLESLENCDDVYELEEELYTLRKTVQVMEYKLSRVAWFAQALHSKNKGLQAKIDELMLEYCPDEMTEVQLKTWAAHQKAVQD